MDHPNLFSQTRFFKFYLGGIGDHLSLGVVALSGS